MEAERSLGQVAYEKHVQVFGRTRRAQRWDSLRANLEARWEAVAAAVIEALMADVGYPGPLCRHVCLTCGGCGGCCTDPGHRTAEEAEAEAEAGDG